MRLQRIVILLTLMVLMASALGGAMTYLAARKSAILEADRIGSSHAENLRNRLDALFSSFGQSAMALAAFPDFSAALIESETADMERVNFLLDTFNHALKTDVCYLMDADGQTIAASNRHSPDSFVGKNCAG